MATLIHHDIAWGNIPVGKDRNIGPRQHAKQCIRVPFTIVTEVALVDTNANSFIGMEESRWVFKVLKKWICYGRWAIGKALVEACLSSSAYTSIIITRIRSFSCKSFNIVNSLWFCNTKSSLEGTSWGIGNFSAKYWKRLPFAIV